MSTPPRSPDVFVSYSSHDKYIADALVSAIESSGTPCWIAPRDVVAGRPYAESIMQGLGHGRLLLLVFTSRSNESPHVLREVERFVNLKRPILCLRIENVMPSGSMEYLISATHWADAVELDQTAYCRMAVEQTAALLADCGHPEESSLRLGGARGTFAPSALAEKSVVSPVLALLPIEDRTERGSYQYLCDGIGEDVIMRLAEGSRVKVVSAHAVALLRHQGTAPAEIAARLNAGWLLEGSLRGDDMQFRLNLRLIKTATQAIQWAQSFDFESKNLFHTQQLLAEQISRGLGIQLATGRRTGETAGQTENSTALDLYFRARHQTTRRDRESMERAIALYDAAIGHDPTFVRAWARLSEGYTLCANYGYAVCERPGEKAHELAERAVMLDESVPEAQVAMGLSLRTSDFAKSADRFRLALALYPSNVEAHHYLAHVLVTMGDYPGAEAENLKALGIDPLYVMARAHLVRILIFEGRRQDAMHHLLILEQDKLSPGLVHSTKGWIAWCDRRWSAAILELDQAMKINANTVFDADICADCYRRLGEFERAKEVIERAMKKDATSHLLAARLAQICTHSGLTSEARRLATDARTLLDSQAGYWLEPRSAVYFYNLAWIQAVTGDMDAAVESLESAFARGYGHHVEISLRPDWESVRTHARFLQAAVTPERKL